MTTTQTINMVGIREDLSDVISNIAPTHTPFFSMIQKGAKAKNTRIEWQKDTLAAPNGDNKVVEGADATFRTMTPTVRLASVTQIMDKAIILSDTADYVDAAGREQETAYQTLKRTKELKRDLEVRLCGNYKSHMNTAGTARETAGFEAWITTNDFRGTGGTQGGYNTGTKLVAAATDASASNLRTFTEARLNTAIAAAWDAGGEPSIVMLGKTNKQRASGFAGVATKYNLVDKDVRSNETVGAVDLYASDYGVFKFVPSRFSRDRSALGIDPKLWSLHFLQPFRTKPLAATGHANKKLLLQECALASRNEAGNFIIADLLAT